jgi:MATE family multidrug resistance protein
LPLVVSTCFWTVMTLTDRMFLLWHSNVAMAAVLPAGLVHFTVLCFPFGVAAYVSTFVAQYHGAGCPQRIGLITWQGIWLSLAAGPLVLATIPLAPGLFRWAGHAAHIAEQEAIYYRVLAFGAGGLVLSTALSSFFTGLGKTWVVMVVDMIACSLNVVLDYAWIFGRWGFPAGGIAGAAWATVVAQWSAVGMYALILGRRSYREPYQLAAGCRYEPRLMARLLRFGSPSGLQLLIEVGAFTLFLLVVGRLGEEALAATNLAFNINTAAWLPMVGMGTAVATMVGRQLGRNRADLAARATWTGFALALMYTSTVALLYVTVPDLFLMGHAAGLSPERFQTLRALTVVLLQFVAAYCLFDAMNLIFSAAIKGAGDTRFVLGTTLLTAPLPVVASWLGMAQFGAGILWCWWAVTCWVCLLGLIYLARFLQGRWRAMRVIEPDFVGAPVDERQGGLPLWPLPRWKTKAPGNSVPATEE